MTVGSFEKKTNIRFKNVDDFDTYMNAIDIDYDSADVAFSGYVYKLNTPQFKVPKRRASTKRFNYKQEIVEYHGQNCYIPISGHCFIECNKYLTGKDYTEDFFIF